MATYYSIIAWRTPQTKQPGRLWSIVFQRVGHGWNNLAHTLTILINIIRLFSPKERQIIKVCFIIKIHPCCFWKLQPKKQTFGLCGRRRGCDVSREQHRNMYVIYSETDHQPRLDAWDKCSGLVRWEDPEGSGGEGGGRGYWDGEFM